VLTNLTVFRIPLIETVGENKHRYLILQDPTPVDRDKELRIRLVDTLMGGNGRRP